MPDFLFDGKNIVGVLTDRMCCMKELVDKNSQFIVSTHSPILMTFPGAEVLEITEEGIQSVDYKDTEHFMITKRFMDAPEKIIEDLLG